jgi:hypothetical protein
MGQRYSAAKYRDGREIAKDRNHDPLRNPLALPHSDDRRFCDGVFLMSNTLNEAVEEAQRFIKAAKKFDKNDEFCGDKNRASIKRSSMDLTRKLAELRKLQAGDWRKIS